MVTRPSPGVIPRELFVPAVVHGRILLEEGRGDDARALLVGFHGYGEGADEMIEPLHRVRGERGWSLAAIQALHPFYRRSDGGVVACWMTKLDRERAIVDNQLYVARAVESIRRELPAVERMAFLGFSQGVAMAYRAAGSSPFPIAALVALAGDVPPDLHGGERRLPPVLKGRGSDDEWYDPAKLESDRAVLTELGVDHEVVEFDGGHEWGEPFVEAARDFLGARLG
jgi:predicted esterase